MSTRKQIFWEQGAHLQPQHYQLLDQTQRDLTASVSRLLTPYFWGVIDLEIRQERLSSRTFELQSGSFLFQDGSRVDFPGNAVAQSRSFGDSWAGPLKVYIGLKVWTDGGFNVKVIDDLQSIGHVSTRFVAIDDAEEVTDLHTGGSVTPVKKLRYVLKILWGDEAANASDYLLIQIAELQRVGADVRLSPDFIPPCPVISGSKSLMTVISEIRDQVTARSRQLEEFKKKRSVHSAEFGSRDMVYILALRSMNRYIPLMHHDSQTPFIHPWEMYRMLRQMSGELSSFSERVNVLGEVSEKEHLIENYHHEDLWKCFSGIQNLISHLLDEITAGPEYIIRLVKNGVYYSAELKPAIFDGKNRFFLAVKTDADPKATLSALEDIAKLSASEELPTLVSRSLPGIGLQYLQVPPQELPRRSKTMYFSIDHFDEQWRTVAKNHSLSLFWEGAPDDLDIELMVIGR